MQQRRLAAILSAALLACAALAIPSPPLSFDYQRVDHFSFDERYFSQRFYMNDTAFGGPGSPIIMIMGGEGAIEPSTGIFYPPVVLLAQRLKALIVEPEHRCYGASQPLGTFDPQRLSLLTAEQALADAARFVDFHRWQRNCTGLGGQPRCPVVTVGGSYPGWLSAMMRLRYPNVVDMSWAASAPMTFYSQQVDQYAYYKVVTASAARASPACPDAVRAMLAATLVGASKPAIVSGLNLCTPLPQYLEDGDAQLLVEEVAMVFMYTWAGLNMANYPPTATTGLALACAAVEASAPSDPWAALSGFLQSYSATRSLRGGAVGGVGAPAGGCYNLSLQLPSGPNATISSGDWSGVGSGDNGASWDFETCTFLVEAIGANNVTDMFIPRAWSLEWLNAHCAARFGARPRPTSLADTWGFSADRLPLVASRIIFTNGLMDGWHAGGILANLSDTILSYNMPNGAHHSDLSHEWPSDADTPDVTLTRQLVGDQIAAWLAALDESAARRDL